MFRQMLIMASVLIKKRPVNHQYNIAGLLEHDGAAFAVVNRGREQLKRYSIKMIILHFYEIFELIRLR